MPVFETMMIISALIGGFSAYQSGVAVRSQNKYKARVARYNQKTAEMEAAFATEQANKKAGEAKMKSRRVAAAQRAAQGSSGFVVGEGSFGDILEDTALLGHIDSEAIKHEGALSAYRAQESAKLAGASGQLYDSAASSAGLLASLNAGTTLLSGLSDVDYGKFTKK